jgi:hypothetical protein
LNGEVGGNSKLMGQLDLLAGKLARSWILLIVCAFYVGDLALLPEGNSTFNQTVKTACKLPFKPKNKKSQLVSPSVLWTRSKKYDRKYVH